MDTLRTQGDPRGRQPGVPARGDQLLRRRPAAARGARARGRRLGRRPRARHRRRGRLGRGAGARPPRRAQRAAAEDARPLRAPDRRDRPRPVVALAAAGRRRARDPRAAVARPAAGRARGARGAVQPLVAGQRRRHVPGLDDLLGDPGAAARPGARRRVGAAPDAPRLRARRAVRHGDDREAGRLGRPRQHHARGAGRRRRLRDHRPQVVLLGADVRRLPRARAAAGGPDLLRRRARPGLRDPAPEGQARHALAAVLRGRVPRRRRAPAGGGGARRPDDHRDGHPHAAGLRDRLGGRHAPRRRRGDQPRARALGVRRRRWPRSR